MKLEEYWHVLTSTVFIFFHNNCSIKGVKFILINFLILCINFCRHIDIHLSKRWIISRIRQIHPYELTVHNDALIMSNFIHSRYIIFRRGGVVRRFVWGRFKYQFSVILSYGFIEMEHLTIDPTFYIHACLVLHGIITDL